MKTERESADGFGDRLFAAKQLWFPLAGNRVAARPYVARGIAKKRL